MACYYILRKSSTEGLLNLNNFAPIPGEGGWGIPKERMDGKLENKKNRKGI